MDTKSKSGDEREGSKSPRASTPQQPPVPTSKPGASHALANGGTKVGAVAKNATQNGDEALAAPLKLREVVAAASAAAPPPTPINQPRPSLTSDKTKQPSSSPQPTFAQAVSVSSGKGRANTIDEVVGRYITPRPEPAEAQLKSRKEGNLQDLFQKRWHSRDHGVCFEMIRGVSSEKYLEAIGKIVPLTQVFAMGPMGQGTILVTLNSVESANQLLLKGIDLAGRHLSGFPETQKPQRVVLSPVPDKIDDQCLVTYLSKFGKVQGRIRALPLRLGQKGLAKGIFSFTREVFITLNPGSELPQGFRLILDGTPHFVEITTEVRCYNCREVGHQSARCPKKIGKIRAPTTAPVPQSALEGSKHAPRKASAENSSDEESGSAKQKKKTRRKKKTKKVREEQQITAPMPNKASAVSEQGDLKTVEREAALMPPPAPKSAPSTSSVTSLTPPAIKVLLSSSDAEKRRRSDDGEDLMAPKPKVTPAEKDLSDLSDTELIAAPREKAPTKAGHDTDTSVVSIASGPEPSGGPLSRSQLRDLIRKVSSKKNIEVVKKIVSSFTPRYFGLIAQIQELMVEAKEYKQYNQEAKLRRIVAKLKEIAVEAPPCSGEC